MERAEFLTGVRSVTAGSGGLASLGVEPLDSCDLGEHAGARVVDDVDEKPRNRIRGGRSCTGSGFSRDAATIVCFPGRSSEVLAEKLAAVVEELSLRGLQ